MNALPFSPVTYTDSLSQTFSLFNPGERLMFFPTNVATSFSFLFSPFFPILAFTVWDASTPHHHLAAVGPFVLCSPLFSPFLWFTKRIVKRKSVSKIWGYFLASYTHIFLFWQKNFFAFRSCYPTFLLHFFILYLLTSLSSPHTCFLIVLKFFRWMDFTLKIICPLLS